MGGEEEPPLNGNAGIRGTVTGDDFKGVRAVVCAVGCQGRCECEGYEGVAVIPDVCGYFDAVSQEAHGAGCKIDTTGWVAEQNGDVC